MCSKQDVSTFLKTLDGVCIMNRIFLKDVSIILSLNVFLYLKMHGE